MNVDLSLSISLNKVSIPFTLITFLDPTDADFVLIVIVDLVVG